MNKIDSAEILRPTLADFEKKLCSYFDNPEVINLLKRREGKTLTVFRGHGSSGWSSGGDYMLQFLPQHLISFGFFHETWGWLDPKPRYYKPTADDHLSEVELDEKRGRIIKETGRSITDDKDFTDLASAHGDDILKTVQENIALLLEKERLAEQGLNFLLPEEAHRQIEMIERRLIEIAEDEKLREIVASVPSDRVGLYFDIPDDWNGTVEHFCLFLLKDGRIQAGRRHPKRGFVDFQTYRVVQDEKGNKYLEAEDSQERGLGRRFVYMHGFKNETMFKGLTEFRERKFVEYYDRILERKVLGVSFEPRPTTAEEIMGKINRRIANLTKVHPL